MTSPALRCASAGSSGTTSETNFSPNRVLGSSRACTFAGMLRACAGSRASTIVARSPSELISRTSPTSTPRTLTSDSSCIWLPMRSVSSVTLTTGTKTLAYEAIDSATKRGEDEQEGDAEGAVGQPGQQAAGARRGGHRAHPAIRTVVLVPQMANERKKSTTLMATIEVRTARPTATPTPAGPPLAV